VQDTQFTFAIKGSKIIIYEPTTAASDPFCISYKKLGVIQLKKKEDDFLLNKEQTKTAIEKIKTYYLENLDMEIGNLQSEIFLDYITKHIGIYYYNKGIADAMGFMTEKLDDFYLLMKDELE